MVKDDIIALFVSFGFLFIIGNIFGIINHYRKKQEKYFRRQTNRWKQ